MSLPLYFGYGTQFGCIFIALAAGVWIPFGATADSDERFATIALVLFGVLSCAIGAVFAWRGTRLLRNGRLMRGKLVSKQHIGSNETIKPWKVTFAYEVNGVSYQTTVRTEDPSALEDNDAERILYDPRNPNRAAPLDHLVAKVRLADDGTITSAHRWPLAYAILPAITSVLGVIALAR